MADSDETIGTEEAGAADVGAGSAEDRGEPAAPASTDERGAGDGPVNEAPDADPQEPEAKTARRAAHDMPRLMTRIFGTPLLIAPEKLDVIMSALGPRLGIAASPLTSDKQADAIGAFLGFDDDDDAPGAPYELTPDGIAIIGIDGTLVYKSSWLGALSGLTAYGDIRASLDQAVADPAVKGILLQVDSYGGEVNGCFDLSDAIFAARSQKPVYAVAADDSYSAAYALASAASKLYVSRTSGVGSVGVVALHVDQSAADKMQGLKYTYVYSGDHKVDGNPHQPLAAPAREAIQAECDRLRGLFAASVARYRGMSAEDVLATQAACFFGENAVAARMADALGTPVDALAALTAEVQRRGAASPSGQLTLAASKEAPASNVIDLDAVREQARGETAAQHVEIVELCALAGHAALAAGFIRDRLAIGDVRKALQNRRADASDAQPTNGHLMPDAGETSTQAAASGWDKAIVAARGKLKQI